MLANMPLLFKPVRADKRKLDDTADNNMAIDNSDSHIVTLVV